jgi:outer membrane protein OmpA-like peptidoglycan-associated protein
VDENDVCPNYAGPKELDGCPDYDGDLVPDHRDACPEVPGEEAYHGCKEGYPSLDPENREKYKIVVPEKQVYKDANEKIVRKTTTTTTTTQAPSTQQSSSTIRRSTTTTSSTSNGQRSTSSVSTGTRTSSSSSSSVSSEVRGVFDEALTGIKFNSSKATLKKSSYATLNKVVRILSINKDLNVSINGHTDSTGDPVKNKSLSLARANSVKKFLMSRGIAENRLKTIGHGIEKPIADNSTPQGRELNRRVEFVVIN